MDAGQPRQLAGTHARGERREVEHVDRVAFHLRSSKDAVDLLLRAKVLAVPAEGGDLRLLESGDLQGPRFAEAKRRSSAS